MPRKKAFPVEILEQGKEVFESTGSVEKVREFLREQTGLKKTQVYEYARQIAQEAKEEEDTGGEIEFKKLYTYSNLTDEYVFLTYKLLGRAIVLKGDKVKEILKRYSRFDDSADSVNEIAASFGLSRKTVVFILKALGKTHDSLPVTDEELVDREPGEIVDDLLGEKMFTLQREWDKRNWKQVNEDAVKWRRFKMGQLNPYKEFVEGFTYQHKPFKLDKRKLGSRDRCYMVGVSDAHFGAYALDKDLFRGREWSIEKAEAAFKKYTHDFYGRIELEKKRPKVLYLLLFGDLAHGVHGRTEKGTALENVYPDGEPQIDAAFRSIDYHIQYGLDMGFVIEVKAVPGNHWLFGDWAIYKFIEKAYSRDERVTVDITTQRWLCFQYGASLLLMEHGASAFYKSIVPKAGAARESYIQRLMLSRARLLAETEHRYFLTADRHQFSAEDNDAFEFIRFGSMVTGDRYADHNALNGRARQNVLEFDKQEGLRGTLHFYVD